MDIASILKVSIKRHVETKHNDGFQEKAKCPSCSEEFLPIYLNRHVKEIHGTNKNFECTECGKSLELNHN